MKYIKQLDVIRALAVMMVIFSHWYYDAFSFGISFFGEAGVDIFFVLSGFLITRILLNGKGNAGTLRRFYARRTLRIFPIYYLTIFMLFAVRHYTKTNIISAFPYLLTYTQNIYFFKIHSFDGSISHLWSLAVEEQFYLIWPWIILFVNKKYLLPIILLFVLTGIVSQYFLRHVLMGNFLTPACFAPLGLGALLSYQVSYNRFKVEKLFLWLSLLALVSCIGIFNSNFFLRTEVSIIALWIISYIVYNKDNLKFRFILNNKILIFIGKISYGLYVYHLLVFQINQMLTNHFINQHLPAGIRGVAFQFENIVLLLAVATFSYYCIEKPILKLKKNFSYNTSQKHKNRRVYVKNTLSLPK